LATGPALEVARDLVVGMEIETRLIFRRARPTGLVRVNPLVTDGDPMVLEIFVYQAIAVIVGSATIIIEDTGGLPGLGGADHPSSVNCAA
jgi:hypothetical protein